jgi:hypothetical protein
MHPVPDFACPGTRTGMQASTPEHLSLGTIENAIGKVLAQIKLTSAAAQMLDLPVEVCGLVLGPQHPRSHMLEVGINSRFQQRCIGRLPTP